MRSKEKTSFLQLQGDSGCPFLPQVSAWHGANQLGYPFQTVTVLASGENGQPGRGQFQTGTASLSVGCEQLSLVSLPLHSGSAQSQEAGSHGEAGTSLLPSPRLLLPTPSILHLSKYVCGPLPHTSKALPPIYATPGPQCLVGLCLGSDVMHMLHGSRGVRPLLLEKEAVSIAFSLLLSNTHKNTLRKGGFAAGLMV